MIDIAIPNNISPEVLDIVSFYKTFDKYKLNTDQQLQSHVEPSIKLGQYKVHKKNNKIVAFTSWAFLSEKAESHYKITGQMLNHFWKSGNRCWIVDSICQDQNFNDVYNWGKNYFAKELGLNKPISFLRVTDLKVSEKKTKYTKKEWLING